MGAVEVFKAFSDNVSHTTTLGITAFDLTDFGFTTDQIKKATAMTLTVTGQICRYTLTGSTPTVSGLGHVIAVGATIDVYGYNNLNNFKIISDVASATVTITLYE